MGKTMFTPPCDGPEQRCVPGAVLGRHQKVSLPARERQMGEEQMAGEGKTEKAARCM